MPMVLDYVMELNYKMWINNKWIQNMDIKWFMIFNG